MKKTPYQTEIFIVKPADFSMGISVAACYIRYDDTYLLLHRAKGKPQELTWGVPAGKIEAGETPRDAVIREIKEETLIELDDSMLKEQGTLYVRYPHVDFSYHMFTHDFSKKPTVVLSDEHIEYRWVRLEDIDKLPLISGALETFLHLKSTIGVSI